MKRTHIDSSIYNTTESEEKDNIIQSNSSQGNASNPPIPSSFSSNDDQNLTNSPSFSDIIDNALTNSDVDIDQELDWYSSPKPSQSEGSINNLDLSSNNVSNNNAQDVISNNINASNTFSGLFSNNPQSPFVAIYRMRQMLNSLKFARIMYNFAISSSFGDYLINTVSDSIDNSVYSGNVNTYSDISSLANHPANNTSNFIHTRRSFFLQFFHRIGFITNNTFNAGGIFVGVALLGSFIVGIGGTFYVIGARRVGSIINNYTINNVTNNYYPQTIPSSPPNSQVGGPPFSPWPWLVAIWFSSRSRNVRIVVQKWYYFWIRRY